MEVICSHCDRVFEVGDEVFENHERAEVACPSCKKQTSLPNPRLTTLSNDPTHKKVPRVVSQVSPEGRLLLIPDNTELSLKVLEGEEKGTVFPISKPRFLIGRTNGDVNLNDEKISRVHCALESSAEGVLLRDLESTNGTLVDGNRIGSVVIGHASTFKVGNHLLQLVIVKREA